MTDTPSNSGHRTRLRRRFLDRGLGALQDYEILELLLTYAIPRRDVKPLAKAMINRFGSFAGVMDATEYDLKKVSGIGENAAGLILLMKASGAFYLEQRLRRQTLLDSPDVCADFARMKLGAGGKEMLLVMLLNQQRQLLHYFCMPGTVNAAHIYPREILEMCMVHRATAVMLAHNHPSGVCTPSDRDLQLTQLLLTLLPAAGIELVDHLLVSPFSWVSMREKKWI